MLREQWIFAALMGLVWCGDTLVTLDRGKAELVLVPGATLMTALALAGRRYPVHCGLAAAATVAVSTVLVRVTHVVPHSIGLISILPVENAAGLLLVLYAFWKRPRIPAAAVTVALVASCLAAVFLRSGISIGEFPTGFTRALGFGFLQLVLAAGTGIYLRGSQTQGADTPVRALLRRQWPTIAALSVSQFLELTEVSNRLPGSLLPVLGCAVMAALAVFAPVRPVEAALLGSFALALTAVMMRLLSIQGYGFILGAIPFTAIASGMLLVAFATRYAEPRKTLGSSAALAGAALFALAVIPEESRIEQPSDILARLFMGGLLLVFSIGTGMYFRARDEERSKSVQAAVSQAQQAERMALARELHDVVAHHVTGIVVQAQAAQMVAENNPRAATEALDRIAGSGTEALAAMRRLVGSLRGTEPAGASGATEQATTDLGADLAALVADVDRAVPEHGRAAHIELSVHLHREIPQEVTRSALRVVQESLTNVRKHALDAGKIRVMVTTAHRNLHVLVADDGGTARAQPVGGSGGYGLIGMRERIELLGGRFSAGPGTQLGWQVEAWLPLSEREQEEQRQ
jgi:signal transduction histidine kinase